MYTDKVLSLKSGSPHIICNFSSKVCMLVRNAFEHVSVYFEIQLKNPLIKRM